MNRFVALYRAGLLGFAASSLLVSVGCGLDVSVGGSTGTSTHGAGGGCSGNATGGGVGGYEVGSGGSPESGSGGSIGVGGSPQSTGTGSTPVACGGLTPGPTPGCAADEYCDYGIQNCGAFDNQGLCKKRPTACDKVLEPTCACNGQTYDNGCLANAAGFDVSSNGGCTPPVGQFPCGTHFCNAKTEYCVQTQSDVQPSADTFACKALPNGCLVTPSCACLSSVACGSSCAPTSNGGFKVTCQEGG